MKIIDAFKFGMKYFPGISSLISLKILMNEIKDSFNFYSKVPNKGTGSNKRTGWKILKD